MDKYTTYNISFGCPNCGSFENHKFRSDEGPLTELHCYECGLTVPLVSEKESEECKK